MAIRIFLKFRDERGAEKRVEVKHSPFFVGRLPECDLPIASQNLSRKHAKIERFGEVTVISDCGSSNGTRLNGNDLDAPVAIKNGDEIELGDEIILRVEIHGATNYAADFAEEPYYAASSNEVQTTANTSTSFLTNPFLIAPLAGILVLGFVGGLIFALAPKSKPKEVVKIEEENEKPVIKRKTDREEDLPKPKLNNAPNSAPIAANTPSADVPTTPKIGKSDEPVTPLPIVSSGSTETDKAERNVYKFLKRISSDTNPFLSSEELRELNAKINALKSSGAFRENLKTAKRNFSQIQTSADGNGLKPMLVTAYSLAKMGERRDTVVSDANAIIPEIKSCANILGIDGIADALLVVAAVSEGADPKTLQGTIGALTKQDGVSSGDARSVRFLQNRGKIKKESLDFVLRFLAVGAISQNPKEFNIDAEAL